MGTPKTDTGITKEEMRWLSTKESIQKEFAQWFKIPIKKVRVEYMQWHKERTIGYAIITVARSWWRSETRLWLMLAMPYGPVLFERTNCHGSWMLNRRFTLNLNFVIEYPPVVRLKDKRNEYTIYMERTFRNEVELKFVSTLMPK